MDFDIGVNRHTRPRSRINFHRRSFGPRTTYALVSSARQSLDRSLANRQWSAGAMVFGGIGEERLQLNEDTLWAGGPYDPVNPGAKEALPEVRKLVDEGKYREVNRLLSAQVMAKPLGQMPYQTVGSLLLKSPETPQAENYRRELNLDTAMYVR